MAKKYDIVETSKMSAEYDGSKITVTNTAKTDLQNGRFVEELPATKEVQYPTAITSKVVLHANVEKMYDTVLGLTEYITLAGEMARTLEVPIGDTFGTTAIAYDVANSRASYDVVAVGDSVGFKATTGEMVCFADATNNGCSVKGIVVEKKTLGYDKIPAIRVKRTA